MHLSIVLILLGSWMNSGQAQALLNSGQALDEFTINSIGLLSQSSTRLSKGEELRLRCIADIARSQGLELISTIYFYKEDRLIYNVTTTNTRATYNISKARVSDTGSYKCRIVVQGKEKKSKEIDIKVSGLLAPSIKVSKTEVTEGEEIIVHCDVPDEDPPMKFIFHKTSTGLSQGQEVKEEKMRNSNEKYAEYPFEIKEGERILHFECTVKLMNIPEETTSPLSRRQTVTVSEPFGKPNINIKPSNNFTEGKVMEVTCSVQKSHLLQEKVVLYLQKGNQLLNSSTSQILTYTKMATVDDIGNYTCKAEGTKASKTTSIMVKVDELFSKPRLVPTQRDINEGERLFLHCSVPGLLPNNNSDALTFYFRVKGQRYMVTQGSFFKDVTERDSGEYTCEVTISNITKISNSVPVKVYAPVSKPILKHIVKGNKMVVLGDTLTLTCKSLAGTPPIDYTLYRGNEYLGTVEMGSRMEAIFTVNATKPHDLGQYRCHASNHNKKVAQYSDFVNVTVITPVGDVDLLVIPKNGEVEEGAVLALVCNVQSGTLPITFWFYVQRGSDVLLRSVNKTNEMHAEHQVTSFAKEKEGRYFCVASNMANKSVRSTSMEVKAVLATWKKGVIGVFICLIIVIAIGIIVYLNMDKKKKGKTISADSSRTEKSSDSHIKKPGVELQSEDAYFGSIQNEEELRILKTDENIGNSQQNHDVEYTEADGSPPDPHQDATENNLNKL